MGVLHTFLLSSKTYPRMRQMAAEAMGKRPQLSIEVESASDGPRSGRIDVLVPLDHQDEFLVPEVNIKYSSTITPSSCKYIHDAN